jgi:TRAP-type C4-dicarboxylate transport system substrate-binding protein
MLAKKGLKIPFFFAINTWPSQQIFSTAPIRTWTTGKGKKIRVYGGRFRHNVTMLLGGFAVNIAFGDVYSALEKKTVDVGHDIRHNAEP